MSEGNVDVARRFYAAYNERDMAAWSQLIGDEFRFRSAFVGVEGRVYEGPDGFRSYFDDLAEAWETFWLEVEDILDAGDDRVLGLMQVHGRGRASGVEIDPRIAAIFHLRDGKVVALQTFMDRAEAFAAADLARPT